MKNADVSTFLEQLDRGLNDDGKWSKIFDDLMHPCRAIVSVKFMKSADGSTFLKQSDSGLNDDGKWSKIFDNLMHPCRAISV